MKTNLRLPISIAARVALLFLAGSPLLMQSFGKEPKSVLLLASYPKSIHRRILRSIRERATENGKTKDWVFHLAHTLGDKEGAQTAVDSFDSGDLISVVCLDQACSQILSEDEPYPVLLLAAKGKTPNATMACEFTTEGGCDPSLSDLPEGVCCPNIVDIGPKAPHLLAAISEIHPRAQHIAVAYTTDDAWNEAFLADLRQVAASSSPYPLTITEFPLSAAACRNSTAIDAAIRKTLGKIEERTPFIVLKGQNTVKFPFLFRRFAEERKLPLVAVGAFPTTGTAIHVQYSPDTIAMMCLDALVDGKGSISPRQYNAPRYPTTNTYNAEILSPLGYTRVTDRKQDASSPKNKDE